MASPQRENGYTALAHELLEALIAAPLGGGALRLLMYLARQSYGYNHKRASLSAAAFAQATNLHPKVVARELRDLEARRYVLVFREEGRTSTYAIQKDYSQWDEGGVTIPVPFVPTRNQKVPGTGSEKVPGDTPTGNQKVPPPGTKTFPVPEPKGSPPSIYKERSKERPKEKGTEPHGSGAEAAPVRLGTLRQQFEEDYRAATDKSKRIGVAGVYFGKLLGPPDYRRIGVLLTTAKSGGAFFAAVAEAAKQTITDNPHDYVAAILNRGPTRASPGGKQANGFMAALERQQGKDGTDGPEYFPDALDAAFSVGPAHRRQQPGGD